MKLRPGQARDEPVMPATRCQKWGSGSRWKNAGDGTNMAGRPGRQWQDAGDDAPGRRGDGRQQRSGLRPAAGRKRRR